MRPLKGRSRSNKGCARSHEIAQCQRNNQCRISFLNFFFAYTLLLRASVGWLVCFLLVSLLLCIFISKAHHLNTYARAEGPEIRICVNVYLCAWLCVCHPFNFEEETHVPFQFKVYSKNVSNDHVSVVVIFLC